MAERIVSPAVFTNEIDSTFLVEGISAIGGAIVGPFTKGPAFSPTVVTSINELEALFGRPQGLYYQPYTAREYLLQQGVVTIVRTGAMEGWFVDNALAITAEYNEQLSSGSLSADVDAGDIPMKSVIGVLANTLQEKNRETQELILKKDLASPYQTSVGFEGSYLCDADGNQVDPNEEDESVSE